MRNEKLTWLMYVLIGIFFSLSLLLSAVEIVAFNNRHYDNMFRKYEVSKATGLEYEDLNVVIGDVLNYLKDDREVLDTMITMEELNKPAFGERAIIHMLDVKELFVKGRLIRTISLVFMISLISYLIIKKDQNWDRKLTRTFRRTASINLLLVLFLYILLQIDFYKYFTYFHLIFFSNDLWILDPNTELMIQMLPEGLFFDTAIRIASIFIGTNIFIGVASFLKSKSLSLIGDLGLIRG